MDAEVSVAEFDALAEYITKKNTRTG